MCRETRTLNIYETKDLIRLWWGPNGIFAWSRLVISTHYNYFKNKFQLNRVAVLYELTREIVGFATECIR